MNAASPKTLASSHAFERPPYRQPPPDAATLERNARAAREFVERVLGQGDMQAFDALVDDEVWVSTGLQPASPVAGKQAYAKVLGATIGSALGNGAMVVHEVLPTLDGAVIVRFTAMADHVGSIDGVAASGHRLTLSEIHLMRFRDGRLVENYVGALNPLHWEMRFAAVIAPQILD